MRLDQPTESLLQEIQSLDRQGCIGQLRQLPGPPLDFTDAYLDALSLERLRHTLLAACLQARKSSGRSRSGGQAASA